MPVCPDRQFGLYVHWPFCQAKCPYCDFNSHVVAEIDHADWAAAFEAEIVRAARATEDRVLGSIYFGGGTPSLMPPATVARIIDAARRAWPMVNDPEITLEANPTSAERDSFRAFHAAGVTRVSVGVQALNDTHLRRLGRLHSADDARRAFAEAAEIFPEASFDLIYARQDQSPDAWADELGAALSLGPTHLSLYQLAVEPGTAFGERWARGGLRGLPDEEAAADMFELTQELCDAAGLPAYEISNHAAPGHESVHNRIYWSGGEWAGIGPGAHGRLTQNGARVATEAIREPRRWLASVRSGRTDHERRTRLEENAVAEEYVMMGLRLAEGISLSRLRLLGMDMPPVALADLSDLGVIEILGDHLRVTRRGRPVLNAVLKELLV